MVELGLAGYALWQTIDDRGADVPDVLRGARDRVFGLGPEVNVRVAAVRAVLGARYVHDLGTRARPEVQMLVCSVTWAPWAPDAPVPAPAPAPTSVLGY
jgi:hypothetical protein